MSEKGLISIQFWPGDRAKAMRLARFIADLEPSKREDTDFLFVARFDAEHDKQTIKHVSSKFEIRTLTTAARATGHPYGCWCLWFSGIEWFYQMKRARKIPNYKWIYQIEADVVPTSKNWIAEMHAEWDRLQPAYVVGAETFHYQHHANGNLMCSGNQDFLEWLVRGVKITGVPPQDAWDIALFPHFARWGAKFSPRMSNVCGRPTMDEGGFEFCLREHSVVHGVKDDSLYRMARRKFLGK